MLKRGAILVAFQVVGIAVGAFLALVVAADVSPDVFSLFGVRVVVETFVCALTVTGFEAHARRRFLHWLRLGRRGAVRAYVGHAFSGRFLVYLVLLPVLVLYVLYLDTFKYSGKGYLPLLSLFLLSGLVRAWLNSCRSLLQSFDRYVAAGVVALVEYSALPLAAFVAYRIYGFRAFLVVLALGPVVVLIGALWALRQWLSLPALRPCRALLRRARGTRPFRLAQYAGYAGNRADQALVALFCSPGLLATFSLVRNLEGALDTFIMYLVDPPLLGLVAERRNPAGLRRVLHRVRRLVLVLLGAFVVCYAASLFAVTPLVRLAGLSRYQGLPLFILAGLATPGANLLGRIPRGTIHLLASPRTVVGTGLAWAALALGVLVITGLLAPHALYWYRPVSIVLFAVGIRPLYRRVLKARGAA